jgi:hypothetical protein
MSLEGKKMRHGKGTFKDGKDQYNGEWKNDAMDGQGTYDFGTGAQYEGEWMENTMNGEGKYCWADKASYTGQWRQNK